MMTVAASVACIAMPVQFLKILGVTVLTGIGCEIAASTFEYRICPEYYTINHRHKGKKLLETENFLKNGFVWGVLKAWKPCLIAGSIIAFAARAPIPKAVTTVSCGQVFNSICLGGVMISAFAQLSGFIARFNAESRRSQDKKVEFNDFSTDLNNSHVVTAAIGCEARSRAVRVGLNLGCIALCVKIMAQRARI